MAPRDMPEFAEKVAAAKADLLRLKQGWRPDSFDLANAVGLENWLPAIDPETKLPVLIGNAIGHPRLRDGLITTSPLLWLSEDRKIARTLSRWYKLGACAVRDAETPVTDPEVGL